MEQSTTQVGTPVADGDHLVSAVDNSKHVIGLAGSKVDPEVGQVDGVAIEVAGPRGVEYRLDVAVVDDPGVVVADIADKAGDVVGPVQASVDHPEEGALAVDGRRVRHGRHQRQVLDSFGVEANQVGTACTVFVDAHDTVCGAVNRVEAHAVEFLVERVGAGERDRVHDLIGAGGDVEGADVVAHARGGQENLYGCPVGGALEWSDRIDAVRRQRSGVARLGESRNVYTTGFPFDPPGGVFKGNRWDPRLGLHVNRHLQARTDVEQADLDWIEAVDDEGEGEFNGNVRTGVVHLCLDDRPLAGTVHGDIQCRVERCFTVNVLRKGHRLKGVRVSHSICRYLDEVGGPIDELLVIFVQASRAWKSLIDHRVVLVDPDVTVDV